MLTYGCESCATTKGSKLSITLPKFYEKYLAQYITWKQEDTKESTIRTYKICMEGQIFYHIAEERELSETCVESGRKNYKTRHRW